MLPKAAFAAGFTSSKARWEFGRLLSAPIPPKEERLRTFGGRCERVLEIHCEVVVSNHHSFVLCVYTYIASVRTLMPPPTIATLMSMGYH